MALRLAVVAAVVLTTGWFLAGASSAEAQDTSLEELQNVVDALFAGDQARVEGLLRYTQVACQADPADLGDPPQCPEGVEEGTLVDVFPSAQCEGAHILADQSRALAELIAAPGPEILGVYRYQVSSSDAFLYGDYVVVATLSQRDPPLNVGGVFVGDGGITGLQTGCEFDLQGFLDFFGITEVVDLSPPTEEGPPALPSTGTGPSDSHRSGLPLAAAAAGAALLAALLAAVALRRARQT